MKAIIFLKLSQHGLLLATLKVLLKRFELHQSVRGNYVHNTIRGAEIRLLISWHLVTSVFHRFASIEISFWGLPNKLLNYCMKSKLLQKLNQCRTFLDFRLEEFLTTLRREKGRFLPMKRAKRKTYSNRSTNVSYGFYTLDPSNFQSVELSHKKRFGKTESSAEGREMPCTILVSVRKRSKPSKPVSLAVHGTASSLANFGN